MNTNKKMNDTHTVIPTNGIDKVYNCRFCSVPVQYSKSVGSFISTDGQGSVRCYYSVA